MEGANSKGPKDTAECKTQSTSKIHCAGTIATHIGI